MHMAARKREEVNRDSVLLSYSQSAATGKGGRDRRLVRRRYWGALRGRAYGWEDGDSEGAQREQAGQAAHCGGRTARLQVPAGPRHPSRERSHRASGPGRCACMPACLQPHLRAQRAQCGRVVEPSVRGGAGPARRPRNPAAGAQQAVWPPIPHSSTLGPPHPPPQGTWEEQRKERGRRLHAAGHALHAGLRTDGSIVCAHCAACPQASPGLTSSHVAGYVKDKIA